MVKEKKDEKKKDEGQMGATKLDEKADVKTGTIGDLISILQTGKEILLSTSRMIDNPLGYDDYFEFGGNGMYQRVPIRAEIGGQAPEPKSNIITYGDLWACGGTKSALLCPLRGVEKVDADWADMTYDPTSVWQNTATWMASLGGWIYHALSNNIRANNHVTLAEMVEIVKYLIEHGEMARGLMRFEIFNGLHILSPIKYILSTILDSASGSDSYNTKDDMRSKLIVSMQEIPTMWPMWDFWMFRYGSQAFARQMPHYKFSLTHPWFGVYEAQMLARVQDKFIVDDQWIHPEVYLREQGIWNKFRDNILPLLFGKVGKDNYIGVRYPEYLQQNGWTPITMRQQMIEFFEKKFHTHPFDELLGVGQYKLPKYQDGNTLTMEDFYWDISAGRTAQFLLDMRAFFLPPDPIERVVSPWLDPVYFINNILVNYSVNNAGISGLQGQYLAGSVLPNGTVNDLSWDQFLSNFPHLALKFNKFETIEPDPDIDLYANFDDTVRGFTWFDQYVYTHNPTCRPVRLPDINWYLMQRRLFKYGAAILNIRPDDVEVYKVQRSRIESTVQ